MIYSAANMTTTILPDAELVLPRIGTFASGITLSSGGIQVTYFTAQRTETCTKLITRSGGTASAGLTTGQVGIYAMSADGTTLTLVTSASDTTMWNSTFTLYPKTVAFPKVAGQLYGLAVLAAGVTMPSLAGAGVDGAFASSLNISASPVADFLGGQTSLPSTITVASMTNTGNLVQAAIKP